MQKSTDTVPPYDPGLEAPLSILSHFLQLHGDDDSILSVSELEGFFCALGCAPDMIVPSRWMPAIWSGEDEMPVWESEQDFRVFSAAVFSFYNTVMEALADGSHEPLFNEIEEDGETFVDVGDWCHGFLRGATLWGLLRDGDGEFLQEALRPIALFATESGEAVLATMSEQEIAEEQARIQPAVREMFGYFVKRRAAPVKREGQKQGRNDPCPCGSGKKYKKCCLR